jgi:type VI secretion system protein VasD
VIRLHAGDLLNSDTNGQSLPVVARIYELREKDAFMRAPAATFNMDRRQWPRNWRATCWGEGGGPDAGQHFGVTETLPEGTRYIGVVALFRAPAPGRWRHVFDAQAAAAGS